jgi:hypothetical protein
MGSRPCESSSSANICKESFLPAECMKCRDMLYVSNTVKFNLNYRN